MSEDRNSTAATRQHTIPRGVWMLGFVSQGNWEDASALAHILNGSGGNIGAHQLSTDAAALEQACNQADGVTLVGISLRLRYTYIPVHGSLFGE